jgi:uncharacterized DUF497 family protein
MGQLRFEWDPRKNRANERKHGVSFEEARTVFLDENASEFHDDEHSDGEERFLLLGLSAKLRILLVSYCLREGGSVIRFCCQSLVFRAAARRQSLSARGGARPLR